MGDTPLTDELIRDVNPESRNADYWILKHQRAVDHARRMETDRARLMEALRGMESIESSVTPGQERERREEWVPKTRALLRELEARK